MILVSITGASGIPIAYKLLKKLKDTGNKTELIISKGGKTVLNAETEITESDLKNFTEKTYNANDLTAAPASGSHKYKAMVIIPCSMKTLASIAHGYADNLITRAADVCIKEKRRLILIVRESPLSVIHLENMLKLAKLGVIIAPPIPAFYIKPKTLEEILEHLVGRILDLLDIETEFPRWGNE
ncbi:MAG: UbiX family flavin prenyltransferase [Candidatus Lokiarchaeota archaeon]